ncbi:hypothetical protein BKA93DRAFT_44786 [Sparassis latifolia]
MYATESFISSASASVDPPRQSAISLWMRFPSRTVMQAVPIPAGATSKTPISGAIHDVESIEIHLRLNALLESTASRMLVWVRISWKLKSSIRTWADIHGPRSCDLDPVLASALRSQQEPMSSPAAYAEV